MKKLLLLLIPFVFLVSCDKDEDSENLLLGEWLITMNIVNEYTCRSYCESDSCENQYDIQPSLSLCLYFDFNENGSGLRSEQNGEEGDSLLSTFSWELNNDQLSLDFNLVNEDSSLADPFIFSLIDIDSTTMILESVSKDNLFYVADGSDSAITHTYLTKIE